MTESADVTLDDLNEEQLQVVEVIGLEAYKRLIHYYAGTSIYIPKFSEIERRKRNEKIRIEYEKNGDIKALALKYGLKKVVKFNYKVVYFTTFFFLSKICLVITSKEV